MNNILKNIVQIGIVSSVNPKNCTARVHNEITSGELSVLVRGSFSAKDYWMPTPGEQVLCIMMPNGNTQGFIVGAFYSDADKPPVTDANKRHVKFPDGTSVEYDLSTKTMSIDTKGPVNVTTTEVISLTAPKGITLTASDSSGTGVSIQGKSLSESW